MVSPGFKLAAETLLETDNPACPMTTFAVFEGDDVISVAVPIAVLGMTVPAEPEFTCARKETDPLAGDVI